jgi:putative transposase
LWIFSVLGLAGQSYDNALVEAVVGLYKTELINRRGPWRNLAQVELATAEWTDWWNQRRLPSMAISKSAVLAN